MITYVASFVTSAAIAISFRSPRRAIPWIGLCGLAAWTGYDVCLRLGLAEELSVFIGAFSLGILAEVLARRLRQPAILFVMPGLFPLVPGIIAYRGMLLIAREMMQEGGIQVLRALFIAGSLAAGLAIPPVLFRRRHRR